MSNTPKTLFEKIWEQHVVAQQPNSPAVLYIDLHLVHEVTSPQAFTGLRQRGLRVRRPDTTVATMDHSIPTTPLSVPIADAQAAAQLQILADNTKEFGIPLHGMDSPMRGIVHVIGPELGLTQPGMTIVAATATHPRTAPLVRWPLALAPARWSMCLPASACCKRARRLLRCALKGGWAPESLPKTSSSR